ncbi:MAG: phosphate ABC transporter substrate-binding protein [Firmicutes bacterium HGW-Firmicutes-9]|nr:MAG: phosphate ABC transporter substrate-binding protein [Firmicutes bacterium HGW-Firmicutes-9]
MKKLLATLIALTMVAGLAACATTPAAPEAIEAPAMEATEAPAMDAAPAPAAALEEDIVVVSREDGSGTRGAFIELTGVEQKDADGKKVDYTTLDAEIVNSTSVVLQTVAGNVAGIGYISLGSLNDTVKAVQIDGADANVENIKSGAYKVARPFNIATQATVSEAAQAFIDFILSAEGQAVIQDNKYIASVDNAPAFAGSTVAGKVVVAGSSSVTPVMEKLKEAYMALNPNAEIEIQLSDSSTGVKMAIEGNCDIGMASRELKDSELSAGVTPTVIAIDGIAIIVNNDNPISGLSIEQVRQIYVGELLNWAEVK